MDRVKAVVIALMFLMPLYVMAAPAYIFRHFTTSDGLLNNEVKAILRDSYGYLWVGTVSGLNRWDGYRLKAYENAAVAEGIMQMGDISELQEDHDGNVWAKCRNGYVVYRRDADRFADVSAVLAKYTSGIKHVQNVHIDKEGNVWAVADGRLHLCNFLQGRHSAVALKTRNGIEDIKSDGRSLLLLDSSGKLHVLDITSLVWKSPAVPPLDVKCNRLYVDKDGAWWMFSTTGDLLLHLVNGGWHTLKLHGTGGRTSNYIRGMQDDGLGNIWIATDHQGLFLYGKRDGSQTNIRHDDHAASSIAENNVGCIHIDRDNILWTGYTRKGLSYHHPSSRHFTNVSGVRNISCIAPGRGGRTWMGTDGYGLRELSSGLTIDIPGNIAVSLLEDNAGRLWVGTYMHGLLCYDSGRLVRRYTVADSPLADNSIYSLQQDRMGRIWTGSLWGHIQCLDPRTGKWQDFRSANREESVAMCLYYEGGDELYAGTLSGLCRINIITGKRQMLHGNRQGKPFLRKDIQAILRDRRGLLWLAHGQGITVWDTHTDSLYRLGRQDGLCDEVVRGMYEDGKGHVWIATSNGCSKVSVSSAASGIRRFSFCNYTTSDGLLDNNISRHSICGFRGNSVLLGTGEGYSIIDAGALDRQAPSQPKVCLTGLSISGEPVVPGNDFHGRRLLDCPMEQLTNLSLKYSDTPIDIEFSSMDLTHSDKVRYAYRLEGLSDRWIETNEPHVTFGSLSPGSYRLLVRACSPDGRWSGSAASLLISVSPPFWLSWYAIVLYVLAVAASAAWWWRREIRRQQRRIERQRIRMEQEQELKMNEMKLRFFTNISHDFRIPLSLILTPLQSLIKDFGNDPVGTRLRGIERNAERLLSLVNQLLDFRKLDAGGEQLSCEPGQFVYFVVEKARAFEEYALQHGISYAIKPEADEQTMMFDADKMLKILSNLLSNAFKYTPDGGEVTLAVRRTGRSMLLIVSDTGCGIPDSDKAHVFERFYQTEQSREKTGSGIGLSIVAEYVAMHGGKVSVADNSPRGTVLTVEIPVVEPPAACAPAPVPQSPAPLPRLLLAEDNSEFRQFLSAELSSDYSVVAVANGRLALEQLRQCDIDIIVTDVMMPEMDGIELCRTVKGDIHTSHIPVLMLTALAADADRLRSLKQGADDYLTKPFNLDVLRLRLGKFMEWAKRAHSDFQHKIDVSPHDITITSIDEKLLAKAIGAVEANLCADFTVEDLASAVGLTRGHLYKKLMAITGKGPADFIRTLRLKRACQLLARSGMQISEVAYAVGYSSPKIFARNFKAEFGVTPSDYVRQHSL